MSSTPTVEEQYTYDGWLVFNELYDVELVDENNSDPDSIIDSLHTYTEGSPREPQSGFQRLSLSGDLYDLSELTREIESFSEDLHTLRYIDEDWIQEWGYDEDGDEDIFYKKGHDTIDLSWDNSNQVMMLRGDKQLLRQQRSNLQSALSGFLRLESISFNFDFFLWILYKEYLGDNLNADIRVQNLTRSKTVGDFEDNLGKKVNVRGSENVVRSLMLIAPVLAGKKISAIQGDFIVDQKIVRAEIEHGGKVHVKVSDNPLSGFEDLRRMGVSLYFLSEILSLFTGWKRLPPEDRYPPPSFFDELADIAEEEGWDLTYDPEDVKNEYERKREVPQDDSPTEDRVEDAT